MPDCIEALVQRGLEQEHLLALTVVIFEVDDDEASDPSLKFVIGKRCCTKEDGLLKKDAWSRRPELPLRYCPAVGRLRAVENLDVLTLLVGRIKRSKSFNP